MNKQNLKELKKINICMIGWDLFKMYSNSVCLNILVVFLIEHNYLIIFSQTNCEISYDAFWKSVFLLYILIITVWLMYNILNVLILHKNKYIKQGEQIVWKK